jgi:radical SAM superfamily enzyme YgiQ (UPF0313 family)
MRTAKEGKEDKIGRMQCTRGLNLLMVYPKCPETFWSFKYALKFVAKKAALPPLGLVTVAAMLPREWQKKIVDLNVAALKETDLNWADLVFISAMSVQADSAREVIERCHKKGLKVVAGGPLFTTHSSDFPEVDHLVLNEGECSLPAFLEDFARGAARHEYRCSNWPQLDNTPCPEWQLINKKKYDSMSIQYSRGCPFNCEFCDIIVLNGRKPRKKSAEQIIRELESLYDLGWRGSVFFVDDNFIGNSTVLKTQLLPVLIRWMDKKKHPFHFFTEASINLADDDELMHMMIRAGFDKVFVGIETPHEESLVECGKTANKKRDMISSIKKMQAQGFEVQGGFIIGFDNDPPGIFEKQVRFIQQSGIITAMVGLLTALRGTRLHKRLEKEGRLLNTSSGDNTDGSLNFIPVMNKDTLINGYKAVLKALYTPKEYYKRVILFLKEYKPISIKRKNAVRFKDILAFFKSIWRLGIIGKERLQYWKLITWTIFRRPRSLHKAIKYAIFGFHFRKVFRV